MSERTVQMNLRKLARDKRITITKGGGDMGCNLYHLSDCNEQFFEWRAEQREAAERRRQARGGAESAPPADFARRGAVLAAGGADSAPKPRREPRKGEPRTIDDDGARGARPEGSKDSGAESAGGPEDAVMKFYQWATGNRVTLDDHEAFDRFQPNNSLGVRMWKIAIAKSVYLAGHKGQKVRSLAYCAATLEGVIADRQEAQRRGLPADPSEDYLRNIVRKIEKQRKGEADKGKKTRAAAG